MRRKLHTKYRRAVCTMRMGLIERAFGLIKWAQGFRQFLLRGLTKVQGEWALICTGHNLFKLFRSER